MTDNELLIAMSNLFDKKLKPIEDKIAAIELTLENQIFPRLQNIESCYIGTFNRYKEGVSDMEALKEDMSIVKRVVAEHSMKLNQMA